MLLTVVIWVLVLITFSSLITAGHFWRQHRMTASELRELTVKHQAMTASKVAPRYFLELLDRPDGERELLDLLWNIERCLHNRRGSHHDHLEAFTAQLSAAAQLSESLPHSLSQRSTSRTIGHTSDDDAEPGKPRTQQSRNCKVKHRTRNNAASSSDQAGDEHAPVNIAQQQPDSYHQGPSRTAAGGYTSYSPM